jgi:hypothetical protein
MENTAHTGHAPIPNAVSATSWNRQLWSEAGILQVAQWQSPDFSYWIVYNNGQNELSTDCTLEHEKHSSAVLNVAEHIMKSQWKLQQPMPAVHNQEARHIAASSGIFKSLL